MKLKLFDAEVTIKSFKCKETYANFIEGDRMSISKEILLRDFKRMVDPDKGFVLLDESGVIEASEPPLFVLKKYCFTLEVRSDFEHRLTIKWYDDELDVNQPLKSVLEKKISCVEFNKYCSFIDLDNI